MSLSNSRYDKQMTARILVASALMMALVCTVKPGGTLATPGDRWLACVDGASAGARPCASVLSSGPDSLVVRLAVPGLSMSARSAGEDVYSLVEIPGEGWLEVPGKPRVPRVTLLVACPEFDDVTVHCQLACQTVVSDLLLYPSPRYVVIDDGGTPGPTEQFCMDEDAYASDTAYPAVGAEVLSIGRIRDQKAVWLGICPVQYSAAAGTMVAAGEVTITLSFVNSRPSLATRGTGPFEDICQRLLVGYHGAGGTNPMALLSAGGGQVVWAKNLQDCEDNGTDYLMIAPGSLGSGADSMALQKLADFRADSCGFNVSIVRYPDSVLTDVTVRSVIKDLYDSRTAAHWWDGHLGFVVLIGDFQDANGDTLMPRHLVVSQYGDDYEEWPDSCASDNWYACVAGDDPYPDLMLGRMSVDNGAELENVVDKILGYEPIPDGPGWSMSVFLTAGTPDPGAMYQDTLYVNRAFAQIESIVESDGCEVSILRGDLLGPLYTGLTTMNADSLEPGRYFVNYAIHADPFTMGYQPNRPKSFTACSVDTLANYGKLCVFTHFGCQSARFDVDRWYSGCPATTMYDCIGERFMNTDSIGAVAYVGQTDMGDYVQVVSMGVAFYEAVFKWHDPVIGMALVETLLKQSNSTWIDRLALLGDPALRIRYRASAVGKYDLWVRGEANLVWFQPPIDSIPVPNSTSLKVTVRNMTTTSLNIPTGSPGVPVRVWISDTGDEWELLGADTLRAIGAWDSAVAEVTFSPLDYPLGKYDFKIVADPGGVFDEADENNNEAIVTAYIGLPPSTGTLPSTPSDRPMLAYLEGSPGPWYHYVLFPCENSWLYSMDGAGHVMPTVGFYAQDGPLYTPSVADSGGAVLEVVASQHKVHCIDLFAPDSLKVKWCVGLGDTTVVTPPCVTDLDGDGELEVSIGVRDPGDTTGTVVRIEHGGIMGAPTSLGSQIPSCPLASVDLNGDGKDDILAGTDKGDLIAIDGSTGQQLAVQHVPLLPATHTPVVAVKIGDLDMDGVAEVVAAAGPRVRTYRASAGLTALKMNSVVGEVGLIHGLAIADVLDDPDTLALEVVVSDTVLVGSGGAPSCTTSVKVFDCVSNQYQILQVASYDVADYCAVSDPVVADLSCDDGVEIVFFTTDVVGQTTMWMWNPNSGEREGFQHDLDGAVRSAVLCDFEPDGYPEIVFAAEGDRSVWSATGNGDGSNMEWQMPLGDERGRNLYATALHDTLAAADLTLWGRYTVSGTVWTGQYNTLTLSPGTEMRFVPSDEDPPYLVCRGPLRAIGREDAPIVFTSADPTPSPGDWASLYLDREDGAPAAWRDSIEHCVVEYGTIGLDVAAWNGGQHPVTMVKSSCLRYNGTYGANISREAGGSYDTLRIEDCEFLDNRVGGVHVRHGFLDLRHSRFVKDDSLNCGQTYGVFVEGASAGSIIDNNYLNAGTNPPSDTSYWDYGIVIQGRWLQGDQIVRRNYVESFYQAGIEVGDIPSPVVVYVDSNCVRSGVSDSLPATLVGMRFTEPQGQTTGAVRVRVNAVYQTYLGVYASSHPLPVLGDTSLFDGLNNLAGNTYYVQSASPDPNDTLKAEMCWWGDQPDTTKFIGLVDYTPLANMPSGTPGADNLPTALVCALSQAYPNPLVAGEARIRFSLDAECDARIEVFNVLGQRVRCLQSGKLAPGPHEVFWDGTAESGRAIAAGVYFYRLETPHFRATKKMVVLN